MRLELLALVMLAMGFIYGVAEHAGWRDSMWLVWQTITTVGYGDIPPKTFAGRFGVMVCGILAIFLMSYVVSSGLDYREDQRRRRRLGLETNRERDCYLLVCCRAEEELLTFITQLRTVKPNAAVCIVDDILEELPPKVAHLPRVEFVRGPILSRDTYERAGIATCRQVIIFPHQPGRDASDATTQTLVTLAERMVGPDVPIMHFLVDQENEDLFEGLRSKAIYADFAIFAAVQECQDQGSAEIFTTLMSNSHGVHPTTFIADKVIGWTWGQFIAAANKVSQQSKTRVNPLALIHAGQSDPCPAHDSVIAKGDSLSLIVHSGFSYSAFEEELTKVGR
jgi:voltage-gated potassium channel Kch